MNSNFKKVIEFNKISEKTGEVDGTLLKNYINGYYEDYTAPRYCKTNKKLISNHLKQTKLSHELKPYAKQHCCSNTMKEKLTQKAKPCHCSCIILNFQW